MEDGHRRYDLGDGEEQLVIPLAVKVIVVVVQVGPPRVVVREYGGQEQHNHTVAGRPFHQQPDQILVAFVQHYDAADNQDPDADRVGRGIEVQVLVGGNALLVGQLEDGVPTGARAKAPVHVARVAVPEVIEHGNMGNGQKGGHQEAADCRQDGQQPSVET